MKPALSPLINRESRILILGSMPGEKSLQLQQYYGNRGNHFWKLMFAVFDERFSEDYDARKKFLVKTRMALWDVLSHCERVGSLDSNIKNEIPNDFSAVFAKYPNISYVVFTSKAAESYYDKYNERLSTVEYYRVPSPSGANAGTSFSQKLREWELFKVLASKSLP
ncbi:MAG: DNA-deoxyinosine glycosylase [Flavobacterium sp.]|nr:MAG: DNA-deoxyinosine glycosylase [Flavobacterium sp.]